MSPSSSFRDEGPVFRALRSGRGTGLATVRGVAPVHRMSRPGRPKGGIAMLHRWKQFLLAEDGQDLVEYALLAALIAMASVVALRELGPVISGFYGSLTPYLEV